MPVELQTMKQRYLHRLTLLVLFPVLPPFVSVHIWCFLRPTERLDVWVVEYKTNMRAKYAVSVNNFPIGKLYGQLQREFGQGHQQNLTFVQLFIFEEKSIEALKSLWKS